MADLLNIEGADRGGIHLRGPCYPDPEDVGSLGRFGTRSLVHFKCTFSPTHSVSLSSVGELFHLISLQASHPSSMARNVDQYVGVDNKKY